MKQAANSQQERQTNRQHTRQFLYRWDSPPLHLICPLALQHADAQALISMYDRCSCRFWRRCFLHDTWQRIGRGASGGDGEGKRGSLGASAHAHQPALCCFWRPWRARLLDGAAILVSLSLEDHHQRESPDVHLKREAAEFDTIRIFGMENRRVCAAVHAGEGASVGLRAASVISLDGGHVAPKALRDPATQWQAQNR